MERDSKGRFVKGNTDGRKISNDGGLATAMQEHSVASRRKRKEGRELVRYLLSLDVKDDRIIKAAMEAGLSPDEVSQEVAMHQRQIEKAIKTGDTKAYRAVMKTAGYDTEGVIPEGVTIVVRSKEEADKLEKLKYLGV